MTKLPVQAFSGASVAQTELHPYFAPEVLQQVYELRVQWNWANATDQERLGLILPELAEIAPPEDVEEEEEANPTLLACLEMFERLDRQMAALRDDQQDLQQTVARLVNILAGEG